MIKDVELLAMVEGRMRLGGRLAVVEAAATAVDVSEVRVVTADVELRVEVEEKDIGAPSVEKTTIVDGILPGGNRVCKDFCSSESLARFVSIATKAINTVGDWVSMGALSPRSLA